MRFAVTAAFVFASLLSSQAWAQRASSVAVTDLAYTERVAAVFSAGKSQTASTLRSSDRIDTATLQSSGTYLEGSYSYLDQRELNGFSADVRSALIRGTNFKLIQGGAFDKGDPQLTPGERAFNAVNSGKIEPLKRQPEVRDIVDRIKKREFNGADYVLFGTLTDIQFRDQFAPIQGTTNASQIFGVDLVAEYTLINTKTYEIAASFSAQGAGSETKLLSNRGDRLPPNRPKVIRDASKALSQDVFAQLSEQLRLSPGGSPPDVREVPGRQPPTDGAVKKYK